MYCWYPPADQHQMDCISLPRIFLCWFLLCQQLVWFLAMQTHLTLAFMNCIHIFAFQRQTNIFVRLQWFVLIPICNGIKLLTRIECFSDNFIRGWLCLEDIQLNFWSYPCWLMTLFLKPVAIILAKWVFLIGPTSLSLLTWWIQLKQMEFWLHTITICWGNSVLVVGNFCGMLPEADWEDKGGRHQSC